MSVQEINESCFTVNTAKQQCIDKLKKAGIKMSKQRMELLDLLFSGKFNCTKELFYEAQKNHPELGMSTVYRFLNVLENLAIIGNSKILDLKCSECAFRLGSLKDSEGREIKANGISLTELVRLGLIAKGVISSNEKIDVQMVDDGAHISIGSENK